MTNLKKMACTFLILFYFLGIAQTTDKNTQPAIISNSKADSLVSYVNRLIDYHYFNKDKSKQLQNLLSQKLKAGEFYHVRQDTVTKRITIALRKETNDLHFYVGLSKKAKDKIQEKKTGHASETESFNGGFTEVKMLPGNIGYIKYVRCIANDDAYERISKALTFLKGCTSLIFDITENPGGDGSSGGFINQYLYSSPDYQNLLVKTCRNSGEKGETKVTSKIKIPKYFQNTPVYIMVSENTGSAAEYFAFIAQQMKRATIVGKTTAGAANPVVGLETDEYLVLIPTCQIKTRDGVSFQGKGVVPDIALTSPKDKWLEEVQALINTKKQ